jgi:hypothetical protein
MFGSAHNGLRYREPNMSTVGNSEFSRQRRSTQILRGRRLQATFDGLYLHPGEVVASDEGARCTGCATRRRKSSCWWANPDSTLAEAVFFVPLSDPLPPDPFGPGVIARWRFTANPEAEPGPTQLQAALIGLDFDDQPNLPLPSPTLLITIVPEPDSRTLLLIGFALLIVAARCRLGNGQSG